MANSSPPLCSNQRSQSTFEVSFRIAGSFMQHQEVPHAASAARFIATRCTEASLQPPTPASLPVRATFFRGRSQWQPVVRRAGRKPNQAPDAHVGALRFRRYEPTLDIILC